MRFRDRTHAGFLLSQALSDFRDSKNTLILVLPRGGVPVAAEVARELGIPFHVLVVRKIGHPHNPEVAIGAVSEFGTVLGDTSQTKTVSDEYHEAKRRREKYEPTGLPLLKNKTVIIIDDGIATGYTIKLAAMEARRLGARHIVIAVPVAPHDIVSAMREQGDEIVVLHVPEIFLGVGAFYEHFPQMQDEEVKQILATARSPHLQSH